MASVGDAKSLGQLLKQRRLDLKGGNNEVTQPEIALAIKQSQAQVWKIEQGQVDITRWFPERQLALLKAYKFNSQQIEEIALRFSLDIPQNVENVTSDVPVSLGNVDGVTIRNVGNPNEGGYTLPVDALQGHEPEDCFFVTAKGGIFACPEVRATHGALTKIFFDRTKKPEEGSMVAYKIKGEDSYVLKVWHETPPPVPVTVQTYDQTRYIVLYPDDPVLEQLGTKFSHLGFGDR